jgi:hypothetical protein
LDLELEESLDLELEGEVEGKLGLVAWSLELGLGVQKR